MSSPFSKWQASKHHIKLSYHFNLHFSKFSVLSSKNSSQDLLEPWQSCRMEMVETRICEHWWFCNDPREQSHGTEGPRKRGFRALTWCPCTWSVHKMPILPPWILTIMLGAGTYFQLPPPALPCRPPWLPLPRINILLSVSISWNTWPAKMMTKGIRICFWRLCRLCRATVMNYHKLSSLNNQKVLCQFWRPEVHTQGVSRVTPSRFWWWWWWWLFSHSVMSDSLRPQGLQHARHPCPSPTPGACSNSCPSSRWCHPIISSSGIPLSSCLQSFPASGSFPRSQFFTSGDQSIRVSASASFLPMNISFRMDWLDLLAVQGTLSLLGRICSLPLPSILVGPAIFGVPWLVEASLQWLPPSPHDVSPMCLALSLISTSYKDTCPCQGWTRGPPYSHMTSSSLY